MLRRYKSLCRACPAIPPIAALLLASAALPANAQEARIQMKGSLSPLVRQGRPLNRLNAGETLRFSFALPLRNQPELDALLVSLYKPGDPQFHHFLTPEQFAARFGPTQADYDAVIAYARQQGFAIAATHSNRALLEVTAPTAQAEKAFSLRLMNYQSPAGRVFRAPDAEPALPAAIARRVSGIIGLDNAQEPLNNLSVLFAPQNGAAQPKAGLNANGTGPNGGLAPGDVITAYGLSNVPEKGTGQTVALFELDGYTTSDITTYENQFGLAHTPLQNILVGGASGVPSAPTAQNPYPGSVEVTLDIDMVVALAPAATKILVYEGTDFVSTYNKIATDNLAQQISTSWYAGQEADVSSSTRNGENTAFQQMASQGQSFYAASGDYGDKVRVGTNGSGGAILKFGVQDPSSQPYATGVGGTIVTTNGAGGAFQSETAWAGSGGGLSTIWTLPTYQSQVVSAGSNGSASARNVPDVSLDSASGYSIRYNGAWPLISGTSAAAPLWAAFNALVNQRRFASGLGRVGFVNPLFYEIGQSPGYAGDFHDITTGNNGTYPAVTGFDNVTGWGSFIGGSLIYDMQVNGYAYYVDGSYNGIFQFGTRAFPYQTVTQAVNAAPASGVTLIYIRGNAYPENLTIGKPILLINDGGGNVLIGGN